MYTIDEKIRDKKLKSFENVFKDLNKTFKEDRVVTFINDMTSLSIPRISTGSIALDAALGGGVPLGRITELFGGESSGKTATTLKLIAAAQKAGLTILFADMEHTFDPIFAQLLGVDINSKSLMVTQPKHLQQCFWTIDKMIDANIDLVILDSTAALVPKEELDGDVAKQNIGLLARYMSQFLRRIGPKIAKSNCSVVFINQIRDNVGVMYGDTTTTPGGRALKFYSSVRIRLSKGSNGRLMEKNNGTETQIGLHVKATCVKNKTSAPYKVAEYSLHWDGKQHDDADEVAEIALQYSLIPKYNTAGELAEKGRNYKWATCPEFLAKSKAEVPDALRKWPQVKEELIEIITNGKIFESQIKYNDSDDDKSESEFLSELDADIEAENNKLNEAEEISGASWDDLS